MPIHLPAPQLLQISGPDAIAFAQAQFCSDLSAVPNGHWQWSAWLSAQGRVRAFFHLLRLHDGDLRLILRGGSAAHLRDALARFMFRAKVQLRVIDDVSAVILHAEHDNDVLEAEQTVTSAERFQIGVGNSGMSVAFPGTPQRWLLLSPLNPTAPAADADDTALNTNVLADIDAGFVTLTRATEDRLLPDWIGLTDLGATSVRKGCYPGQEIVARLHFKGNNKRWLHRVIFDAATLPEAGTSIGSDSDASAARGTVLNAAWIRPGVGAALAVVSAATDAESDLPMPGGVNIRSLRRIHAATFT